MRKQIGKLIAMGLIIGLTGTAYARGSQCEDGHGNPHYCFQPDEDQGLTVYTVENTVTVEPHKTGSVSAYCDDESSYAVGGGESTNPVQAGVVFPQRAYVTENAPIFTAPDTAAAGWIASVVNGSAHAVTLRVFATCLK